MNYARRHMINCFVHKPPRRKGIRGMSAVNYMGRFFKLENFATLVQKTILFFVIVTHCNSTEAHTTDYCADRVSNGSIECSYRPQVVGPWTYGIPGPLRGTPHLFDEQSTKQAFASYWQENCPNCCDPGSLTEEGQWVDQPSSWGADFPVRSDKALTYQVIPRVADGSCGARWTFSTIIYKIRDAGCDLGWSGNWSEVAPLICYRAQLPRKECRFGHPIALPSGSKVFTEVDYSSVGKLRFIRDYRSEGFSYEPGNKANLWLGQGPNWRHNYSGKLITTTASIWVKWQAEAPQYFALPNQQAAFPRKLMTLRQGQHVQLLQLNSSRYLYYTSNNEMIVFDSGTPTAVYSPSGLDVLIGGGSNSVVISDVGGRQLVLNHNNEGRLYGVQDPAGGVIYYGYKNPPLDSRNNPVGNQEFTSLSAVIFQDQTVRRYIIPDWTLVYSPNNPLATRIIATVDELGKTFQTITYNVPGGTVKSTSLAGGVGTYSVSGGVITDPLGASRNYMFSTQGGGLSSVYQPAGAGCSASSSTLQYDSANGSLLSSTSHTGSKTCYVNDITRNLETARVDGLNQYATCTLPIQDNASLPAGSRKTSKQWHPDWRLSTKVAEPGRITTSVYNGQPDSFAGNAIASCAPSTALLPDGKPIAVLCKQVEQATTDANGASGFSAALQAGVANRVTTWTYNQWGQVLTENGPRTDVNDTTTYAYYSDTSFTGEGTAAQGHYIGDLQSITNAAGRVTQYSKYNRHGQLLESADPNGVLTVNTYDLRQRLLSTTVAGLTTNYTYDLAGQLKRVTLPDTSWVGYDYDDAHRQVAVYDNKGNRTDYLLDNAGNRIGETTRDPGGALKRQLSRSIDALGRVQQTTGRE